MMWPFSRKPAVTPSDIAAAARLLASRRRKRPVADPIQKMILMRKELGMPPARVKL